MYKETEPSQKRKKNALFIPQRTQIEGEVITGPHKPTKVQASGDVARYHFLPLSH